MKKKYIKPDVVIEILEPESLLSMSDQLPVSDAYADEEKEVLAKENKFSVWEE